MLGAETSVNRSSNDTLIAESLRRAGELFARDPAFARSLHAPEVLSGLESARSSIELFLRACDAYAERPAVAYREPGGTSFTELTFRRLGERVTHLSSGWQRQGLIARGDYVALVAFGGPEFLIAELALVLTGATAVPLQTGLAPTILRAILDETRARAVVCDRAELARVTELLGDCPALRSVIALTHGAGTTNGDAQLVQAERDARARDVRVVTIAELEASGAGSPRHAAAADVDPNPLRTIVYTSGSTGAPKGALFPENVYIEKWRPARARSYPFLPGFPLPLPICGIFSPLSHQMGNELLAASLMRGAVAYLALSGDSARLFEELRAARPAFIGFVPRVANQIYDDFKLEVHRRSAGTDDRALVGRMRADVMREMRETYLGDRLLAATSASAPIGAEVLAFLRECFRVPVYNLMGMTETGGFAFDDRIRRDNVLDFRLIDADDCGFCTTDRPYPRGELLLRTRRQVQGYFQSPAATRATFTDDGYVRTGDIFEQRDGESIRWIARKNQTKKLAHGKFVNLTELEATFVRQSELLKQVYLYADSERSYPLAVLVPDSSVLGQRLASEIDPSSERLRELLRGELLSVGRRCGLKAWEIPRDFIVEPTPFSRKNGLVADNDKLLPARLAAKYGPALEALYGRLEQERERRLAAVDGAAETSSVADKLRLALGAVVNPNVTDDESWLDFTFSDVGGDSISAMAFVALLERQWRLKLPVALVLNRAVTLAELVRQLEKPAQARTAEGASLESLHVEGEPLIPASDFTLEAFGLADVSRQPAPATATASRTVLLTGASGFLGRFLVLDLLDRAPRDVTRVIALVRAHDAAAGRERMLGSVATDPELSARMAELCQGGRLEVVAGDLIAPRLGLSAASFAALADSVDTVVHAGALVNHALGYDALFEPNVLGSAEVARLAATGRAKSILFVSTVGLAEGLERSAPVLESERAASLWPARARSELTPGYGYTTSKWAGELLLQELAERRGVPVVVVRCGNLMAHERARGQINVDDFLSRLMCGLVYAGVAPASFYRAGDEPVTFDGVPVEAAASVLAELALASTADGFRVYQLVGEAAPGALTLDGIVDAMTSYGLPLERMADHAAWYRTLSERLEQLAEPRRRRSPLPLLARFRAPLARGARMDASELTVAVARARGLRSFAFPVLGESFVHKCLDDLSALGVFR